jgi:hypothetical protein
MGPKLFDSTNAVTVGIYTALAGRDVSCAWRFVHDYQEPSSYNLTDHICAVNRYWREQFANVVIVNTIDVRAHLIDDIELSDWLRLFAQNVAPLIVALDLPQPLSQCLDIPQRSILNVAVV